MSLSCPGAIRVSVISPFKAKLLEVNRLKRETETRKNQDNNARERLNEEDERNDWLESTRKTEEKRVAGDRWHQRELSEQLEKLRLNSEWLCRQLSVNDKRYTVRLHRSDKVPLVTTRASVSPSQQAVAASDSQTVISPASPARTLLTESFPVQFEPSYSDSHDHPSHYLAMVPVEGACCSPRQLDYCSCSVAIVAPGRDTAVLYSNKTQRIKDITDSALGYLTLLFLPSIGWTTVRSRIICLVRYAIGGPATSYPSTSEDVLSSLA